MNDQVVDVGDIVHPDHLTTIRIAEGDVIVLRLPDAIDVDQYARRAQELASFLREHTGLTVPILCLRSDTSIEQLDEAGMNAIGWYQR